MGIRFSALVLTVFLLSACAIGESGSKNADTTETDASKIAPPIEVRITPKVGDRWVYAVTEQGKASKTEMTLEVVSIIDGFTIYDVVMKWSDGKTRIRETRDENLNIVNVGTTRYDPSLELFSIPIELGKRPYSIERMETNNGRLLKMKGDVEVYPEKKVVTSAGEFVAYLFQADGRYIEPRSGQSNRYQIKTWFAPDVGFYVKMEYLEWCIDDKADCRRVTQELKSFTLQPR